MSDDDLNAACAAFMREPALKPLLAWWAGELCLPVAGGPVDPLRLAMAQGDRERLMAVQMRAAKHDANQRKMSDAVQPDGVQRSGGRQRRGGGTVSVSVA